MATGDSYRVKAAEMNAKARNEANPDVRTALEHLVLAYLRLAEHADRLAARQRHEVDSRPCLHLAQNQR